MGTALRIALVATILGGAYWLFNQAKQAFSLSIVRYGSPHINGASVTLPITIRFNNPTPFPINLDSLHADIFLQKYGQWVRAGVVDQPISIQSGISDGVITPKIDLGVVLGGGIPVLLSMITSALSTKSLSVRADVTARYGSLILPTQSFTSLVALT